MVLLTSTFSPTLIQAQSNPLAETASSSSESVIGTTITAQNWHDYKNYMPDGMIALFQGKYFWRMPPDVAMPIGPTIIHPLPCDYREATEKYANQVKLVELPIGGLTLEGYNGVPFPNPAVLIRMEDFCGLVVSISAPPNSGHRRRRMFDGQCQSHQLQIWDESIPAAFLQHRSRCGAHYSRSRRQIFHSVRDRKGTRTRTLYHCAHDFLHRSHPAGGYLYLYSCA